MLVEVAAAVVIANYYYGSVRQSLTGWAGLATSAFQQYREDPTITDFDARVRRYVAEFSQQYGRAELMTIDGGGVVNLTSSGFAPEVRSELPDYGKALDANDRTGWDVHMLSEQRVMALCVIVAPELRDDTLSAVRLVVSLNNVDRQITLMILAMIGLGVLVLIMVLFSSSYFISSIINPIGEVAGAARRIAQGDFGTRLHKKNNDEIGELCDIINYMAGELATSEKLKNDFIYSVSHELRTPLTAIQGWAETLRSDGGQDKEILDKGMGVIIGETTRLSSMVEELLDFSRMESGRLRLVKGKIDALAELSEAVLMYTERARREGIELIYSESDLIAPVYGDKNKLRQVFVNIIDNAIKYSDSGGTVTVSTAVAEGMLTITVSDTGIGIREEDLPAVKQKFYKADYTRRGSGIGLAVADEIVSRHGGTLSIASRHQFGTTVTVTLPIYKSQDEQLQVE